ncbi:MAG: PmoA family protein, partial [Limisphaerales bacterium]
MRFKTIIRDLSYLAFALLLNCQSAFAAKKGFAVEETASGATVTLNGKLFTKYVIDQANKPFLWPVMGPGGIEMTRAYPMAKVEGERHDHPHHRSFWFGHQGTDGFDTWHEKLTIMERRGTDEQKKQRLAGLGSTVHRKFRNISANKNTATIVSENDYVGSDGRKLLSDVRTLVFRAGKGKHIIDIDIELIASYGEANLSDKKDSGFSVRVPTSMDVDSKKGGTVVNSNGTRDKAAWGKRAKWVDYNGPVNGKKMGVAILNHPSSLRYPTPWHVRTYGLFTANPFGTKSLDKSAPDGIIKLKKGESVK